MAHKLIIRNGKTISFVYGHGFAQEICTSHDANTYIWNLGASYKPRDQDQDKQKDSCDHHSKRAVELPPTGYYDFNRSFLRIEGSTPFCKSKGIITNEAPIFRAAPIERERYRELPSLFGWQT